MQRTGEPKQEINFPAWLLTEKTSIFKTCACSLKVWRENDFFSDEKNISGEGIATFYDAKEDKMFTEPVYFFQRDFFALYGENEILG